MSKPQFHEDFEREQTETGGSDRSFGVVFAAVFAVIAALPLLKDHPPRWWAAGVAAVFLLAALAFPGALAPLNRAWMLVGRVLNRIVSPVVMTVLFVLAVVPTALVLRALGRDPLRLRFDRGAQTYWIKRTPPGPARDSFSNQF